MSASDAAPLPRLGEIFFDVRGSSRSMRLSWYDNTGVAVFSIWQGGTCTGTFRLPMDDLTRLVDSLRRGVLGGQDDETTGPIPLSSQRPRLAIGAAPSEPFTGMMTALTDDRMAAYGLPKGRQSGAFATIGTSSALSRNGAEPVSLSGYTAGARAGAGGEYSTDQYGTGQYSTGQFYGTGQLNGTGAGQQYGSVDQYGNGQVNGTASQYGQYGQAQQYATEAGRDGQSRFDADGQAGNQRADYQYGSVQGGTQYDGASGYADPGYGDTGYADTGYGDQGFGDGGQPSLSQQGEPVSSYSSGPQRSYGFQSSAGQQSFGDGQASSSQAYGGQGQSGAGQAGYTYQSSGAPEASHGDDTGSQPAPRYTDQAAYGQSTAQSYDARAYESRQQAAPSREGESYDQAYAGQGYAQQGYQQSGYGERGYDDQGYAAPSRAEQAPASPEFASETYGYSMPGQQDAVRTSGQYQEYGYGQQQDQPDGAAAQRGQQSFAPQASLPAPQQWQDPARTGQPAAAPGYPAGIGAVSALSAPVPPDSGAAMQQSRGAAPAAATFNGQQSGAYGTPVAETDRYATSSYREQASYAQSGGYQAPAAQPDTVRYPGMPLADVGGRDGASAAASGYAAGTGAAQVGYQPTATGTASAYGYDQQGYNGNGYPGGYAEGDRAGTGAFPSGTFAASAPAPGAYPQAPAGSGYATNGYAANGYPTNGYPANGSGTGEYQASELVGQGSAPSGAYPSLANGYPVGYDGGTLPGNGLAAGAPAAASAVPAANGAGYAQGALRQATQATFTPSFTANGSTGQSVGTGYAPAPGYGAAQAGGTPAYQATPAYANGNGAGYPTANGNGYSPTNANANGYAANGGPAPANGYPRDGYVSGPQAGIQAAGYPSGPGYAPASQAEQAQQGYWDPEQQPRGNWS